MPDLDLTTEPQVPANAGTAPTLATTPYDPSRDRERLRGRLAVLLLVLLALIAAGSVAAIIAGQIDSAKLKDILGGVFTPLLAVFGTITGFYFGNAQASQPAGLPIAPPGGALVPNASVPDAPVPNDAAVPDVSVADAHAPDATSADAPAAEAP